MSGTAAEITMFERIGGLSTIDRLVDSFYRRMDTLPEAERIRAMHSGDLSGIKAVLNHYLAEWTGGPPLYSRERGHPRLRARHLGFPIGEAERDAWLLCMRGALEETVADAEARAGIDAALTRLADWMRNQAGNPHDAAGRHP